MQEESGIRFGIGSGRDGERSQNFEGRPSRFPRTNRASSIRGNTHGGCLGERKHTVSLHYGCNGVDHHHPPSSTPRFPTTPAGVYTVRDGWLDGATLPLAFIYNQIPCIPATDARLNFYPSLLLLLPPPPPPSCVCTRARDPSGRGREGEDVCYNAHERTRVFNPHEERMPEGDGKMIQGE